VVAKVVGLAAGRDWVYIDESSPTGGAAAKEGAIERAIEGAKEGPIEGATLGWISEAG
jgi:hypothetical protein